MYRMMIGSRSSHIGWDDFDVGIVDFLSGGLFENQPAQMKLCKEQWDSDLSTEIEIASKKKKQVTVKRKSIRLPYRNPSGTMGRFVTECEAIAAADPVYRARFGLEFQRRVWLQPQFSIRWNQSESGPSPRRDPWLQAQDNSAYSRFPKGTSD
ncbi:hypothetical protein D6C89_07425 [Aureobasidium pullulans]|nr:hypothetical protein D6C89_07425 [Aureobasidium pullulans]